MFELCTEKVSLSSDRTKVVRLMKSFTSALVAPPHRSVQQCSAYVCTYKDEGFSVYIYLYLSIDKTGILYRYSGSLSSPEERQSAEEEACQFTEDMGFLMDDLSFDGLDASQQEALLSSIPMFNQEGVAASPSEIVNSGTVETVKAVELLDEKTVDEVVKPVEAVKVVAEEVETAAPAVFVGSYAVEEVKRDVVEEEALEELSEKGIKSEPKSIEKNWMPENILSKFRVRALTERRKKNKI